MNRRRALVLLAVVLGAAVAVGLVLVLRSDDDAKVAGPTTTTTTTAPLTPTAHELVERLKAGRAMTFHATYSGNAGEGVTLTIEVWRKGGSARQDLVLASGDVRNQLTSLQLPDGTVACQRTPTVDWQCQRTATAAPDGEGGVFDAAVADLSGKDVTAKDEKVGDRDARCYTIAGVGGSSEMCVTADGLPVRFATADSTVELTAFEATVDEATFRPPAPITDPTTSSRPTDTTSS